MTSQHIAKVILVGVLGVALMPVLVFAETSATGTAAGVPKAARSMATTTSAMSGSKMEKAKAKAGQEIDRRVASLNELATRIGAMQEVRADFKQSLSGAVGGQIAAFTSLKAKIDADTDLATLKSDIQSITQSYRVYALVLPQTSIAAAADRVVTLTTMMTTLGSKLQTRIAAAQSAGTDVSLLSKALNDLSQKLTDANAQAQSAVALSSSLVPDGGDKTKMASNNKALKAARADIQTAENDLKAGRKDITTILKGLGISMATASSTPATASATTTTTSAH